MLTVITSWVTVVPTWIGTEQPTRLADRVPSSALPFYQVGQNRSDAMFQEKGSWKGMGKQRALVPPTIVLAWQRKARLLGAVAVVLLLTACGSNAAPAVEPTPQPGQTTRGAEPTMSPASPSPPVSTPRAATMTPSLATTVQRAPTTTAPPTRTATDSPSPTAMPEVVYVGQTDGDGVYLRQTPQLDDRLTAYPDGTRLVVLGPDVEGDGRTWKPVRAPDGSEGYVPLQYTVTSPNVATPPSAASAPASVPAGVTPRAAPVPPAREDYINATIIRVVDADTVDVTLQERAVRLRLIGIDAPEPDAPGLAGQCFGPEARARARTLLAGQFVRLERDASQNERAAPGLLPAYVWLPDGSMYNQRLLAEGYAQEDPAYQPYRYQAQFQAAERAAREQEHGLWAADTCAGVIQPSAQEAPASLPSATPVRAVETAPATARTQGGPAGRPTPPATSSMAGFEPKVYTVWGDAYDCGDFPSQAQAQAILRAAPSDPNQLAVDGQRGIACVERPAPQDLLPVRR